MARGLQRFTVKLPTGLELNARKYAGALVGRYHGAVGRSEAVRLVMLLGMNTDDARKALHTGAKDVSTVAYEAGFEWGYIAEMHKLKTSVALAARGVNRDRRDVEDDDIVQVSGLNGVGLNDMPPPDPADRLAKYHLSLPRQRVAAGRKVAAYLYREQGWTLRGSTDSAGIRSLLTLGLMSPEVINRIGDTPGAVPAPRPGEPPRKPRQGGGRERQDQKSFRLAFESGVQAGIRRFKENVGRFSRVGLEKSNFDNEAGPS